MHACSIILSNIQWLHKELIELGSIDPFSLSVKIMGELIAFKQVYYVIPKLSQLVPVQVDFEVPFRGSPLFKGVVVTHLIIRPVAQCFIPLYFSPIRIDFGQFNCQIGTVEVWCAPQSPSSL
jgi:hypothetical protein